MKLFLGVMPAEQTRVSTVTDLKQVNNRSSTTMFWQPKYFFLSEGDCTYLAVSFGNPWLNIICSGIKRPKTKTM